MYSLRRLLSPNYAVIPIGEGVLLREPWSPTCALLVIPGGGDLGYCRVLNGEGNRRIAEFVRRGGAYLGLCAGGYYASRRCEFEVGNPPMEVVGSRELAFFPGTCRGGAFKGFEYASERGARAARLRLSEDVVKDKLPAEMACYYNGGGVFVDAEQLQGKKVHVLASYCDELDVDGGRAAVVQCRVGEGNVILCGTHPEFAAENLHRQPDVPGYDELIASLARDERTRSGFLALCLERLSLEVNDHGAAPPALTSLHLSAADSGTVSELLYAWRDVVDREHGQDLLRGEADTFRIRSQEGAWNLKDLREALPDAAAAAATELDAHGVPDYKAVTKDIVAHEQQLPDEKLTPRFNHRLFFSSLQQIQSVENDARAWGNALLYGDVVTSTNVLLEKNPKLIAKLPSGFTFTASTQLAGRGRGTNVWLAPPGSLLFSVIINHPANLAASRPVVFIQYIAAIAVVEAIQSYGRGYENLQVKLKWPNDIYALDPSKPPSERSFVKIGGILSQCGYYDGSYQIILGIGINAVNPRPTTSISDMLGEGAAPLHLETLLARILARAEAVYAQFRREGFSRNLESRYYNHWLHTGQEITLEAEAGTRARVLGITRDWGMLRVEETDRDGRGTGRIWSLQSDENSFDYWKGLVRRKE
ncbi:Biotin--acetyl-CoA-carboxylase ligase [Cordyceps fumosorosea ARSEF 2679]|uniref:Biotin--acetyl-CoA-carboxylase ligase n=1 Tax=Cordyceps fumosorosea (strain ARSEF 2679) TaxID=1081104 RepID=A0A168BXD1_CORFA|nr:Biotin--acetyl-CoA-carboxylase ligase [Cordyceps fumosorosea ARSEF 2679]OAA70668.1 Biotin--acetyl-CoA-carboxylase ligase [Cordyceps fumosorosea ARSEF 2679]